MMKLWHSVIIGVAIIAGLVLHASIKAIPEMSRDRRGAEMQVRMMEMTPKEIKVGETTFLYLPSVSYHDLSISVDYKFFAYVDGQLKQVKLVKD